MDLAISKITGIDSNVINGTMSSNSFSIAQRMSWASGRSTTRVEDMAYSLFGLFQVNMPLLYGEGEHAFLRLQQEIMKDSDDETIFAWKDETMSDNTYSGLLAAHPRAFASCGSLVPFQDNDRRAPYHMTNKGLSITLRLARDVDGHFSALLHGLNPGVGHRRIGIHLKKISQTSEQYARIRSHTWARTEINEYQAAKAIYIKQSFDQRPAYNELEGTSRNIRLFRVLPTEDVSIVKLRLMEADMETSRYTALSYVWPTGGATHTVWVNSEPLEVAEPLFEFLQKSFTRIANDLFWVDAICIQRNDFVEQSHQIAMEGQIFRHATKAVAWLGDVDADQASLDALTQMNVQSPLEAASQGLTLSRTGSRAHVNPKFSKNLKSLLNVAEHPYWTRVWSAQELLFSPPQEARIQLDNFRIRLVTLKQMYQNVALEMQRRGLQQPMHLLNLGRILEFLPQKEPSSDAPNTPLVNRTPKRPDPPLKFETLLKAFQFQKSHNVRDRIAGLIGISDLAGLNIDYSASPLEVFFQVVSALGAGRTLTVLPLLLQSLRISLNDGHVPRLPNGGGDSSIKFTFTQVVHEIVGFDTPNDASLRQQHPDAPANDDPGYLTVEDNSFPGGSLAFAKAEPDDNDAEAGLQTRYKPSFFYIRVSSDADTFVQLPSTIRHAFVHTYGVLDYCPDSTTLRITADQKGVTALGFCMQFQHPLPMAFKDFGIPDPNSSPVDPEHSPTASKAQTDHPLFTHYGPEFPRVEPTFTKHADDSSYFQHPLKHDPVFLHSLQSKFLWQPPSR